MRVEKIIPIEKTNQTFTLVALGNSNRVENFGLIKDSKGNIISLMRGKCLFKYVKISDILKINQELVEMIQKQILKINQELEMIQNHFIVL